MASTSVVLPWSTWATMATFLMSSRFCMGASTIGQVRALSCGSLDCPLTFGGGHPCVGERAGHSSDPLVESTLVDLERDQVSGGGPPPHHPAGRERAWGAQHFDHRRHAELGSDGGAPRSPHHDQVDREGRPGRIPGYGTDLSPAAEGEEG